MPFSAEVYEVVIASPGDVQRERSIARDVVYEWTTVHSRDRQVILLPTGWETHSAPQMGGRPQELINKQLVDRADLLVGVFWTRIGSPTGEALSGSVEEIQRHISAGKPVLLYFSAAPVHPDSIDPEQYEALRGFRSWCEERGLVEKFDSLEEFRAKFSRQLAQTVIREFGGRAEGSNSQWESAGVRLALSDDAKTLLVNAAADPNGVIMRTRSNAGVHIQTNERNFVESSNPRSEARWQEALSELVDGELVAREGEMYQVTHRGYETADRIRADEAARVARLEQRDARLSALAREAIEKWNTHGSLAPILDRERGLPREDQDELAQRAYAGLGRSAEDGLRAVEQWREARAKR